MHNPCYYELTSQTHQDGAGCWSHKDNDNMEVVEPAGAALHLRQGEYLMAGGGDSTAPPSEGAGSGFLALKKLCMHNVISDLPLLAQKKKKKKKELTSFNQPTRPITCANHGNNVISS